MQLIKANSKKEVPFFDTVKNFGGSHRKLTLFSLVQLCVKFQQNHIVIENRDYLTRVTVGR